MTHGNADPGQAEPGPKASIQLGFIQEDDLSPTDLLARIRADQQQRWQSGERVPVEAYLCHPKLQELDDEGILDLIFSEVMVRHQKLERPPLEEYLQRFPKYPSQIRRRFAGLQT